MTKVIPVVLETQSITRVGSTGVYFDYSAADIVTYKLPLQLENTGSYYIPAIPATSFKGVLRSTYERHLRKSGNVDEAEFKSRLKKTLEEIDKEIQKRIKEELDKELQLYHDAGLLPNLDEIKKQGLEEELFNYFKITGFNANKACYVTSDLDHCENVSLIEDSTTKKFREAWNKITGRNSICEVCKIFGTSGVRGNVKFTDLIAIDPFPVLYERFTHVAINRVTGTAESGKLFTEEIIPAGVKFLGFLIVLDDEKVNGILEALKVLKEKAEKGEVWIGGRGTSGYGTFRLYIPQQQINLSPSSIIGKDKITLNIAEPKCVQVQGLLDKLFPCSVLPSILPPVLGEEKQIITTEDGQKFEAKTAEELKSIIDKLEKEGKKYKIETIGSVELL